MTQPHGGRDMLPISVRAYLPSPAAARHRTQRRNNIGASEWTIVFDTETTTDAAQQLRVGPYQVREGTKLREAGVFYDQETLSASELVMLRLYAERHSLRCVSKAKFVDHIFYGVGYDLGASIVGFNLPFDISRLAFRHSPARGKTMCGGFSFQLSEDPWKPRVQIKHISGRAALIQFAKPRAAPEPRGMRNRRIPGHTRAGIFSM